MNYIKGKIKKIISEEDFKKLSNDNAEIVLKGEILQKVDVSYFFC